ncbi:MAG: response regulator [Magnetococcus sp. MYC-9]
MSLPACVETEDAGIQVLLIDDQPLTAHLVRQMLVEVPGEALQMDYLQDPLLAEARILEKPYDVILLDLVMPCMDGFELLQRLRLLPASHQLPIIILTSNEDAAQKAEAFALGANDYLIKLPDEVELLARLRYYGHAHRAWLRQQAAERELLEREAHLQAILDNALDAILTVDRQGLILEVNPAAAQLFGYARPAMLGQPMERFIRSTEFWELFARWVADDQPQEDLTALFSKKWEVDGLRENGLQIDLKMAMVATQRGDKPCFTAFLQDVTDHKQLLKSLGETLAVAEVANRVKSDFLATMSHEIRTPMNAIIGLSDLALQTELPPKARDYLSKVCDASQILLRIINDILDYSKMDVCGLQLEAVEFHLRDLFNHLADLFRDQAREKGVALLLDLPTDCFVPLRGDAFRLEHILINLLSNAIKFTDRGSVTCRVRRLAPSVKEFPEGDAHPIWFEFAVQDTGIGLSMEQQDRLFRPFVQADSSTTRRYGGTGLGLSICKRIVDAMDGQIRVESRPGEGSLFCFTLPLMEVHPGADSQSSGADPSSGLADWVVDPAAIDRYVASHYRAREKVVDDAVLRRHLEGALLLLVEDMPINQQVARELLEQVGIRVDVAEDGETAVRMAATQRYDVILMDIQMPGMDGYAATRIIRKSGHAPDSPLAELPIIAMTAHALFDDQQHCLAVGMNDHVSKPIDKNQLYQVLCRWVTRKEETQGDARQETAPPTESPAVLMPERLPGIDVADGLYRTGHNHRLYRALLQEFVREFADSAVQLHTLLLGRRREDLPSAARTVHAMRGMAGNLAARQLFLVAQDLEQAIQEERRSAWPQLLEKFAAALQEVVASVQSLPVDETESAEENLGVTVGERDLAVITPLLGQLASLVAEGNVEALARLKVLKSHLGGEDMGRILRQLGDALEQFDFDEAQTQLTDIAERLQISLGPDA